MSTKRFIAPLAMALALATHLLPAKAGGGVDAIFLEPDSYTDIGRDEGSRQRTLRILTDHFRTMADRLPAAQTLRLEFVDIDLAGRPGIRRLDEIRWGSTSPRFKFHFRLAEGSRVLKQGYVDLFQLNHELASRPLYMSRTELVDERRLLDEWFDQTVLVP